MSILEYNISYKPWHHPWAMELALEHDKAFWGEWEAELRDDVRQWKGGELSEVEYNHVTQILRLFTQSDAAVANTYCSYFIPRIRNNEIRCMLLSFAHREVIHQRAYALLNDTLGLHESEYLAFLEYAEMADKITFMLGAKPKSTQELALACARSVFNEGVMLFAAFAMLLNYQRHGKMLGMCKIAEWSMRDESLHVQGMSRLFRVICDENPEIVTDGFKLAIYDMARQVEALEFKFVELAYRMGEPIGLSAAEVVEYVRYIIDRRLVQMGLKPNFGVENNPLPWLDWVLSGDSMTNFFEQRVTEYSADGMIGSWGW